jgi:hypothetical protein
METAMVKQNPRYAQINLRDSGELKRYHRMAGYLVGGSMHSQTSNASSWTRHLFGLDVHRDTIVACVYHSDTRRSCYETEFATQLPKELHGFIEHVRLKYGNFRCC